MSDSIITTRRAVDVRYPLPSDAGSDAVHTESEYGLAATLLTTDSESATGIVLTLGEGNP